MTDITPLVPKGKQVIEAYGNGGFRISGIRYEGAVLVTPDVVVPMANPDFSLFGENDLQEVLSVIEGSRILLVGTGAKQSYLKPEAERLLKPLRIVADCMDTGAACRTYNVLLTEGRQVSALLFPMPSVEA